MSTQIVERMAVEIDGEGDAVILLHGLGGSSNTFTPQMPTLRGLRAIRPDFPGSGRSAAGGTLSIQGFVDAVVRMARVLGVERAHLVGHSMGTIVCQHLATQQPRLARSLLLLGPLAAPPDAARQGLRERAAKARAEGMADIADAVVQAATSADTRAQNAVAAALVREMLMRQDAEGYARTCEALAGAQAADPAAIKCPTLLVAGDEDVVAPASGARAMAERIEGAQIVVLNRCGHWLTFERAREVSEAMRSFYSGRAR
jgi:pimeloyl-ACP methyl ester carboxylesterase